MSELILAIDVGTTSIKAAVIDRGYRVVSAAQEPTFVQSPRPGHREIDMHQLGQSMGRVLQAALSPVEGTAIAGISVTGQGDGAWLLDRHAEPVGPAILWNDARAAGTYATMRECGDIARIQRTTRGSVHPGSLPVIARHLRSHDPELLDQVHHQLNCKDWIRYLLTDQLETEASDACRSYLDTADGVWHPDIFTDLGDLPQKTTLPLATAEETRPLSTTAAAQLGLPSGIPVGVGVMDVAAVGYAFCADQIERAWAVVGTTSFVGVVRDDLHPITGNWMSYGTPGLFVNSLAPMIGTPLLEWARAFLGHSNQSWSEFEEFALTADAPTHSAPLTLPYLAPSGERAPFVDPSARGSIHGLSYSSTPADVARSLYTGLALSIAECIAELNVAGPIGIAGGGSASDLLCQLIADHSGSTVERPSMSAAAGMIGATRRLRHALQIDTSDLMTSCDVTRFRPQLSASDRNDSLTTLRRIRDAETSIWELLAEQSPPKGN